MNDQTQELQARIADLEAQLYAIGARRLGQSIRPTAQADTEAPLRCDVCGVECANPWHFSTETKRHKHACDACWDRMKIPGQVVELDHTPAPQQEPVAWRLHPFDYGVGSKGVYVLTMRPEQVEMWTRKGWKVEPLYTAPDHTENLNCNSNQKRLATLWGYVKQDLAHQPLTDEQIIEIANKTQTAEPGTNGYILPISFARAIEQAHNITGDQQ